MARRRNEWQEEQDFEDLQEFMDRLEQSAGEQIQWDQVRSQSHTPHVPVPGIDDILTQREEFQIQYLNSRNPQFDPENPELVIDHEATLERYYDFVNNQEFRPRQTERVSPRYTPRQVAPEYQGGGFGFSATRSGEMRPHTFGGLLRQGQVENVGQLAQMPTDVVVGAVKQQMVTQNHFAGQYGRPVGNQTGAYGGVGQMTYTTSRESVESYFNLSNQAFGAFTAPHAQMPPELVDHAVRAGVDVVQNLAATDFVSTSPDDQLASMRNLSKTAIRTALDSAENFLEGIKTSPDDMPGLRQKYETVMQDVVNTAMKTLEDVVKSPDSPARLQARAHQISTPEEVEYLRQRDPRFASRTEGMSAQEVLQRGIGQRYYSESLGGAFELGNQWRRDGGVAPPGGAPPGGGGFGTGDGEGPLGMFNQQRGRSIYGSAGPAGSLFYGMYMARRTWQMAVDPLIQQSQEYTDVQQMRAQVAGFGQKGGYGADPTYIDRSTADVTKMRAAYDVMGGFDRMSQDISQGGQRMRSTAQLAGGAVMAGVVGQWTLGSAGSSLLNTIETARRANIDMGQAGKIMGGIGAGLTGIAPALGIAGLAIGGGMLLGQGMMELYNATQDPEVPLTWGELINPRFGSLYDDYEDEARDYYREHGLYSISGDPGLSTNFAQSVETRLPTGAGAILKPEDMVKAVMFPEAPGDAKKKIFGSGPFGFNAPEEKLSTTEIRAYLEASGIADTLTPNQLMEYGLGPQYERQLAYEKVEEGMIETFGGEPGSYAELFSAVQQQFGIGRAGDVDFLGGLYATGAEVGDVGWVEKVAQLGSGLGLKTGSPEMQEYILSYQDMTAGEFKDTVSQEARKVAVGQSFGQYFTDKEYGEILQQKTGIITSQGMSQMSRIMSGMGGTEADMEMAANVYNRLQRYGLPAMQTGALAQSYGNFMAMGLDPGQAFGTVQSMMSSGLSAGQISGIASFDPFAIADAAWQSDPFGAAGMPVQFDQWGVRMGQYSGVGTANWAAQQAGLPTLGQEWAPAGLMPMGGPGSMLNPNSYSMSTMMEAIQPYGFDDPAYAQAYIQGGMSGVQNLFQSNMAQYQSAQIGIGFQGIALRENAYWGAGRGGTWDNPAANSIWGLQDQMSALQYKSQMEGFQFSKEGLEQNRAFDLIQRSLEQRQTDISRGYQDWMMGFQRETAMMGRERSRERADFQDMMGGMQFGWNLEDINDAISRSSGLQRKQLVTQRERMTTQQGLQTSEQERERAYQEEMWAREDERFEKQIENILKIRDLEDERTEETIEHTDKLYVMQKEHLEFQEETAKKQHRLQMRLQEEQRKLTMQQMELQKASLGIQAAMLQEQEKMRKASQGNQELLDKQHGMFDKLKLNSDAAALGIRGLVTDLGKLNRVVRNIELPWWMSVVPNWE